MSGGIISGGGLPLTVLDALKKQGASAADVTGRAGVFCIAELDKAGAITDGGERFEWTADRSPANGARGGARAIPLRPWTLSGQMRSVRTDYPGARVPSEQVLGPVHDTFTLAGRWDDRYNFIGYAVEEMRRFEAMCRRGNLVRISFQNQVFDALVKTWKFPYHRDWYIQYEFSVSVHQRTGEDDLTDRSPTTARSPSQHWYGLSIACDAGLNAHSFAPMSSLALASEQTVRLGVKNMSDARDVLGKTLDQHDIGADLALDARSQNPFRRIATQFRSVQQKSSDMRDTTLDLRSDTTVSVRTAMSVLNFENWTRSIRFTARTIIGLAQEAAIDAELRDEPTATRLYRPRAGESLYAISRRFYGTPYSWRLIADRNHLQTLNLTGDELLVIPERGQG